LIRSLGPAGACVICTAESESEVDPLEYALAELRRIDAHRCRESLAEFVRRSWAATNPGTPLEWGPHIEAVCWNVQQQLTDRGRAAADPDFRLRVENLVVNVPPRSLKTTILVCATVWAWLHWPAMRIMYLSANPRVAINSGRAARDLITSAWFQDTFAPEWSIRGDQDALSDFGNTAGGSRVARGIDSTITGEGAHWIIVDDPHDLRDSASEIEKACEAYNSAVHNRINDPRASIRTLIMQRVSEVDLSEHLLAQGWQHVRLPMEYEAATTCKCGTCGGANAFGWQDWRTVVGEVLHPRFTPEFLASEKKRLGPYGYAGQMQQRPAPVEGGLFKKAWFRRCDAADLPRMDEVVISLDANAKKTAKGSRAALVAVGRCRERYYVVDAWAEREELPEICAAFRRMISSCASIKLRVTRAVVEDKALGPAFVMQMREELRATHVAVEEISPGDDKMSRARAVVPPCAAGNVALLRGMERLEEFEHELCVFPNGSTDDYVDSFSQAITHMTASASNAAAAGLWRL
jgi:predicted phage terminase large subunit-like protein